MELSSLMALLGARDNGSAELSAELNSNYVFCNSVVYDRVRIMPNGKICLCNLSDDILDDDLENPTMVDKEIVENIRQELQWQVAEKMVSEFTLWLDKDEEAQFKKKVYAFLDSFNVFDN